MMIAEQHSKEVESAMVGFPDNQHRKHRIVACSCIYLPEQHPQLSRTSGNINGDDVRGEDHLSNGSQ
jgi:hypothetical protein